MTGWRVWEHGPDVMEGWKAVGYGISSTFSSRYSERRLLKSSSSRGSETDMWRSEDNWCIRM